MKADIRLMREELNNIERSKQPKERSLAQLRSSLEAMQSTKEGLESELHQELMTQLSVNDQLEVDRLNDDIRRLTQENKDAFIQRMRLEADKNKLENLLTNNLIRRRDELQQALQEISVEDRNRKLDHCRSELVTVDRRLDDVSDTLKDVEKKVSELTRKQKEAQVELEKLRAKEKDIDERLAESAKDFDKMASRQIPIYFLVYPIFQTYFQHDVLANRSSYAVTDLFHALFCRQTAMQQKIAECTDKIRDLGSLPSDSFDKYHSMPSKQLFKQLEKANSELKKYRWAFYIQTLSLLFYWWAHCARIGLIYHIVNDVGYLYSIVKLNWCFYSHVNKKALDQFISFSEEKTKLLERKDELDRGYDKIKELMSTLEYRKYEALQFTFKQVSKYFSEVFQRLVPAGHAYLKVGILKAPKRAPVITNSQIIENIPQHFHKEKFSLFHLNLYLLIFFLLECWMKILWFS